MTAIALIFLCSLVLQITSLTVTTRDISICFRSLFGCYLVVRTRKQETGRDFVHCDLLINADMAAIYSKCYNNRDAWNTLGLAL